MNKKLKIVVAQHGSRHRYAIPRMLHEAGLLEAIFTDSSAHSFIGKLSKYFNFLNSAQINRLAERKITGISTSKIYSSDILIYEKFMSYILKKEYNEYNQWCHLLSKKMIKWLNNHKDADFIYNMFAENLEFIKYVKANTNIKVITDVYVHPLANKIIKNEKNRLGLTDTDQKGIQNLAFQYIEESLRLSDILICPSIFVADGVIELNPELRNKIVICPYGSSITSKISNVKTKPGRILWAGGDWVRKGLHVFAEAASILKKKHPEMEFVVAGINKINTHSELFSSLDFLGKLNQDEITLEYLKADCFVLPTFAEGMASVIIEALSAGCPVITTKAAGIDGITSGKNGYIIPESDPHALVTHIDEIYQNRALRHKLSTESKILADQFDLLNWKKRIVKVFEK